MLYEVITDENLHELRIEGKKFRYLLEFFHSLFDQDAVDEYLKQMKKLQNTLGDFNDLAVQKDMLSWQLKDLRITSYNVCYTKLLRYAPA